MKSEAIVMTLDFGRNHFSAIALGNQFKLLSHGGDIISIPVGNPKMRPEQTGDTMNQLIEFFKIPSIRPASNM